MKKCGVSVVSGVIAVYYYAFSIICLGPTLFLDLHGVKVGCVTRTYAVTAVVPAG